MFRWRALLVLFCLAGALSVPAQSNYYEDEPKLFEGGILLGAVFSQIDGDTYFGYHKVGVNFGGRVYAHFTPVFGATLEIQYAQKGSRGEAVLESPTIGTYVTKYYMNVNYVEVPLTLHAILYTIDLEAGVSYARLVRSKEWILSDKPVVIDPEKARFNTTDFGYVFGIGRRVYKGLRANLRFQYSMVSIRPPERIPTNQGYGNIGQFNNLFNFRLIYLF